MHEIGPVVPMHIGRPLEAHILKTMGIRGKAISNKVLGESAITNVDPLCVYSRYLTLCINDIYCLKRVRENAKNSDLNLAVILPVPSKRKRMKKGKR